MEHLLPVTIIRLAAIVILSAVAITHVIDFAAAVSLIAVYGAIEAALQSYSRRSSLPSVVSGNIVPFEGSDGSKHHEAA